MIRYLMICRNCGHMRHEPGAPGTFCIRCGERHGSGFPRVQVRQGADPCQILADVATAISIAQGLLGCGQGGGGGPAGGNTCDNVPSMQEAIVSNSALKFLSGIWFGGTKSFQGYDCITLKIDPSLEAQGIGGYNDPDNRVLALNSDALDYMVLGAIPNIRIGWIEGMELIARHTESDVQAGAPALGRTYVVAERGHREKWFDVNALPQAGA